MVAIAALLIFHGVIGRVKATILRTIYKLIKLKGPASCSEDAVADARELHAAIPLWRRLFLAREKKRGTQLHICCIV